MRPLDQTEGYDPTKSMVSDNTLADFIDNDVQEDITTVPGIGSAAQAQLASGEEPTATTYQLIGKFLSFRGTNVSSIEQCDALWYWLQAKGVASHRSTIVHAIGEKVNTMMPGTYEME